MIRRYRRHNKSRIYIPSNRRFVSPQVMHLKDGAKRHLLVLDDNTILWSLGLIQDSSVTGRTARALRNQAATDAVAFAHHTARDLPD
jgi:hypothetical protein